MTVNVRGLCPHCGMLKDARFVPPPRLYRPGSGLWDDLELVPLVGVGVGVLSLAILAVKYVLGGGF